MKTAHSGGASSRGFSSADFWLVPDRQSTMLPANLIHRSIMQPDATAASFSAERRHPVRLVDLPSHTLSMTIGRLLVGQSSRRHRHNYEALLYICQGKGTTFIEDQTIEWQSGDAIYIPVWAWHHHQNRSVDEECLYVACENAPLLQNLGGIALREEQG